jgi:formylmethanofuran dehydrogenase subunit E
MSTSSKLEPDSDLCRYVRKSIIEIEKEIDIKSNEMSNHQKTSKNSIISDRDIYELQFVIYRKQQMVHIFNLAECTKPVHIFY